MRASVQQSHTGVAEEAKELFQITLIEFLHKGEQNRNTTANTTASSIALAGVNTIKDKNIGLIWVDEYSAE